MEQGSAFGQFLEILRSGDIVGVVAGSKILGQNVLFQGAQIGLLGAGVNPERINGSRRAEGIKAELVRGDDGEGQRAVFAAAVVAVIGRKRGRRPVSACAAAACTAGALPLS